MDINLKHTFAQIFNVLQKKSFFIHDDTCLHKLIDILRHKLKQQSDIEDFGIVKFLQYACQADASVCKVVFAIQLTGILGKDKLQCRRFQSSITELLEAALQQNFKKEPSIGVAFYNVLMEMPMFVLSALNGLLSKTLANLQQESSIFLSRSIIQFVTLYFHKCMDDPNLDEPTSLLDHICNHIMNIPNSDGFSENYYVACFDIMKDVVALEKWRGVLLHRFPNFIEKVIEILKFAQKKLFESCLECFLQFLLNERSDAHKELKVKVVDLVDHLVDNDFSKGQEICYKVMKSGILLEHNELLKSQLIIPLRQVTRGVEEISPMPGRKVQVLQQVKNRTDAIKLFCSTIEKIIQLNIKDEETKDVIVKTFEATIADDYSSGDHSILLTYIQDSQKVQQKCLYLISKDINNWLPYKERLMEALTTICQKTKIDIVTYTKCLEVVTGLLPHILSTDDKKYDLNTLVFSLQRHLCAISWEGREVTLSFIQNVLRNNKDDSNILTWLSLHRFDVAVWQAISDTESYVRATAVSCLSQVLTCPNLRTHLSDQLSMELDAVILRIEDICRTDTEAFVRRSVVDFFITLWGDNSVISHRHRGLILNLMSHDLITDFDWEVKLRVVEFWKHYIETDLSQECATNNLEKLPSYAVTNSVLTKQLNIAKVNESNGRELPVFESGCLNALFSLADDFDQSVVEKALELIKSIKDRLKGNSLLNSVDELGNMKENEHEPEETHSKLTCPIDQTWDFTKENSHCMHENHNSSAVGGQEQEQEKQALYLKLCNFDVESKLAIFSQTCDEYDRNPMSLLDDILACDKSQENNSEDFEDENNVVDCY